VKASSHDSGHFGTITSACETHITCCLPDTFMVIQSTHTVSVKLHLKQDRLIESAPTVHNWHQCTSSKANLSQQISWNTKVATILVNLSVSRTMLRQLYFTTSALLIACSFLERLTNDLLHASPHAIKGSCTASDFVDVLLEGVHTPGLGCLAVLSPQVHNVLLQAKNALL